MLQGPFLIGSLQAAAPFRHLRGFTSRDVPAGLCARSNQSLACLLVQSRLVVPVLVLLSAQIEGEEQVRLCRPAGLFLDGFRQCKLRADYDQ